MTDGRYIILLRKARDFEILRRVVVCRKSGALNPLEISQRILEEGLLGKYAEWGSEIWGV
jgi:hypothetical protein